MVILAHFPLLASTGSFTANGSCLGLTFDQCGDRAQTKQAQCLGAGGGGWGGREADHLPSTQALFGLPWRSGPPSSPSLFIAFALSPLSCRLSLCSAPHNCHPLLTWAGPPLSPLGTCVCAKPPTPHPGATATNSRTRLPRAGVFVLVHCSVYPHRLEWCQAHKQTLRKYFLRQGWAKPPSLPTAANRRRDSKAGVRGAGDWVGIFKDTRPSSLVSETENLKVRKVIYILHWGH